MTLILFNAVVAHLINNFLTVRAWCRCSYASHGPKSLGGHSVMGELDIVLAYLHLLCLQDTAAHEQGGSDSYYSFFHILILFAACRRHVHYFIRAFCACVRVRRVYAQVPAALAACAADGLPYRTSFWGSSCSLRGWPQGWRGAFRHWLSCVGQT